MRTAHTLQTQILNIISDLYGLKIYHVCSNMVNQFRRFYCSLDGMLFTWRPRRACAIWCSWQQHCQVPRFVRISIGTNETIKIQLSRPEPHNPHIAHWKINLCVASRAPPYTRSQFSRKIDRQLMKEQFVTIHKHKIMHSECVTRPSLRSVGGARRLLCNLMIASHILAPVISGWCAYH